MHWMTLEGAEMLLFSTASRLTLGPAYSPIQCVLGTVSTGVKILKNEAVFHFCQALRIRMHVTIFPDTA
jgi:hypothetical protein